MIEAFGFLQRVASAAWRSFKSKVDQSPLVFILWIWLPLTVGTLGLLGQIIDSRACLFCAHVHYSTRQCCVTCGFCRGSCLTVAVYQNVPFHTWCSSLPHAIPQTFPFPHGFRRVEQLTLLPAVENIHARIDYGSLDIMRLSTKETHIEA